MSYGGESSPDELLEGLKHIRKRRSKTAAYLVMLAKEKLAGGGWDSGYGEHRALVGKKGPGGSGARSTLPKKVIDAHYDKARKWARRMNREHGAKISGLPKDWHTKLEDGSYMTYSVRSKGQGPKQITVNTHYAPGWSPRGGPNSHRGIERQLNPNMPAKLRKADKKVDPRVTLRKQFGIGKKRLGTIASNLPLPDDPGRLSPSLRLPSTQGAPALVGKLNMSKRRLTRLARRVKGLRLRGLKF